MVIVLWVCFSLCWDISNKFFKWSCCVKNGLQSFIKTNTIKNLKRRNNLRHHLFNMFFYLISLIVSQYYYLGSFASSLPYVLHNNKIQKNAPEMSKWSAVLQPISENLLHDQSRGSDSRWCSRLAGVIFLFLELQWWVKFKQKNVHYYFREDRHETLRTSSSSPTSLLFLLEASW